MIPRRVRDWVIGREIGRGGMGIVFECWRESAPHLKKAIKVVSPEFLQDPKIRRRFDQEAAILSQLRHPNVLNFHESFVDDDRLYLITELLEGETLHHVVDQNRLPLNPWRAATVIATAAEAVGHAHDQGIVHRDLKPANVFLLRNGDIRILDFGLARLDESPMLTSVGMVVGTPVYLPPEVLVHGREQVPGSDVYALGAILFQCLTGALPFPVPPDLTGAPLIVALGRFLERPPPPTRIVADTLPDALCDVVDRAISHDTNRRYTDGGQLARELGAAVAFMDGTQTRLPDAAESRRRVAEWFHVDPDGKPLATQIRVAPADRAASPAVAATLPAVPTAAALNLVADPRAKRAGTPPYAAPPVVVPPPMRRSWGATALLALAFGLFSGAAYMVAAFPPQPMMRPLAVDDAPTAARVRPGPPREPVCRRPPGARGGDMCWIEGDRFEMGCMTGDDACAHDEFPLHEVTVGSFWLDRTEVTVSQYRDCVKAGACAVRSLRRVDALRMDGDEWSPYCNCGGSDRDGHPINCVSWFDAVKYCEWAGKRLPTEAEWEYAARGRENRRFPWGEAFPAVVDQPAGNFADEAVAYAHRGWSGGIIPGYDDRFVGTAPTAGYAAGRTPDGHFDLGGNVAEWVGDWYGADYYSRRQGGMPLGPESGITRVIRGGSFIDARAPQRSTSRRQAVPQARSPDVGFRCAK